MPGFSDMRLQNWLGSVVYSVKRQRHGRSDRVSGNADAKATGLMTKRMFNEALIRLTLADGPKSFTSYGFPERQTGGYELQRER